MKTEGEMIREFVSLTGANDQTARVFLTSCHWDVKKATIKFKQSSEEGKERRSDQPQAETSEGKATQINQGQNTTIQNNQRHESEDGKFVKSKISRGFSVVVPDMVSRLHSDIKSKGDNDTDENYGYFQDVTHYSFTLPDFFLYDKDFVDFLMRDLVESSTLKSLEESGHLNWWIKNNTFQRLLPLATSGDGNCLLHAASLGIWGVHDRLLNLRQAVHRTLSSSLAERTIKSRWRWYEYVKNMGDGEMVWEPTEEEWEAEWKSVLSLALAQPRIVERKSSLSTVHEVNDATDVRSADETPVTDGDASLSRPRRFSAPPEPRYESLEEIHVFSLAHVLRRPIIVIADTVLYDFEGNALCPIPFGGVYLPVECNPAECCRAPLILAYSSGHFSPLVAMETKATKSTAGLSGVCSMVVVPLVDKSLETLPLPFAVNPVKNWTQNKTVESIKEHSLSSEQRMKLLKKYLDVVIVTIKMKQAGTESKPAGQSAQVPIAFGSGKDGESQDDTLVEHSIAVVELPCSNQPGYYQEMIGRYIDGAKKRFMFEKETKEFHVPPSSDDTIQCASDGCELFGTVANNYLCTKCFQLQTKSIKEFETKGNTVPSSAPPSYAEATNQPVFYPPVSTQKSHATSSLPTQCLTKGCTFYGTADKKGLCSKCYQDNKK